VGFLDFLVAATGRSVCYHCSCGIPTNSLRWQFVFHARKYRRWVHLRCALAMIDANPAEPWLVQCIAGLERGGTGLTPAQQREVDDLLHELRSRRT